MLGERVKLLRKEKKWSQARLAKELETVSHLISKYEAGKLKPSADTIVKIARLFNVSTDYLLMDSENRAATTIDDTKIEKRIKEIKSLSNDDKISLFHMLDALLAKEKLKALASEIK